MRPIANADIIIKFLNFIFMNLSNALEHNFIRDSTSDLYLLNSISVTSFLGNEFLDSAFG